MNLFVLALLAVFADIASPSAQVASKPVVTPPVPDKEICQRVASTGSILSKRVCHTRAVWAQIDAANQSAAEAALGQRRNQIDRR